MSVAATENDLQDDKPREEAPVLIAGELVCRQALTCVFRVPSQPQHVDLLVLGEGSVAVEDEGRVRLEQLMFRFQILVLVAVSPLPLVSGRASLLLGLLRARLVLVVLGVVAGEEEGAVDGGALALAVVGAQDD